MKSERDLPLPCFVKYAARGAHRPWSDESAVSSTSTKPKSDAATSPRRARAADRLSDEVAGKGALFSWSRRLVWVLGGGGGAVRMEFGRVEAEAEAAVKMEVEVEMQVEV